jgi:hypothetical protein
LNRREQSISQFIRLEETQRNQRTTLADRLEVLSRSVELRGNSRASFRIGGLKLPSNDVVSLVDIVLDDAAAITTLIVSLSTSKFFHARRTGHQNLEQFGILELDRATISSDDLVILTNGTTIRAVGMIPVLLLYKLSELDFRIIRTVISMIDKEQHCCIDPYQRLMPELSKAIQSAKLIDFSTVYGHEIPLLKQIRGELIDRHPEHKPPSEQEISDTLTKIGMRHPVSRGQEII